MDKAYATFYVARKSIVRFYVGGIQWGFVPASDVPNELLGQPMRQHYPEDQKQLQELLLKIFRRNGIATKLYPYFEIDARNEKEGKVAERGDFDALRAFNLIKEQD